MALTYEGTIRPKLRSLFWSGAQRPIREFAAGAIVGGFGVVGLASMLPGQWSGSVGLAVLAFCFAVCLAGWKLRHDYPFQQLGLCNYVTLLRLVLVCALLAPLMTGGQLSWAVFTVATVALVLDGIDGWLARRQGLASGFGARFDVEVDSALALILAVNLAMVSEIGPAVILLGLPRYAFCLAALGLPWMRQDLPERFSRKVVCVLQLGTLIALQAPVLPPILAAILVPIVAAALAWSFAKDILWLWRHRT